MYRNISCRQVVAPSFSIVQVNMYYEAPSLGQPGTALRVGARKAVFFILVV